MGPPLRRLISDDSQCTVRNVVAANDCRNAIILGVKLILDHLLEDVAVGWFGRTGPRTVPARLYFDDLDSVELHQGIAGVR